MIKNVDDEGYDGFKIIIFNVGEEYTFIEIFKFVNIMFWLFELDG